MKSVSSLAAAAVLGLAFVSAAQAQSYGPTVDYQHPWKASRQANPVRTGRSAAVSSVRHAGLPSNQAAVAPQGFVLPGSDR